MKPLRLLLLGPPRIERDDQILEVDTRKATALLAYLALSGERPSRDFLAAFLWPEFDDSRAKAALRRTLSTVKTAVGAEAIFANREAIGLAADAIWCDATAFQHALQQQELETAVALYRDDFLSGFSLRDSLPFDDWQVVMAQTLRRDLETALEKLVSQVSAQGNWEKSLALAHRWLALDPLREEVHCQLMQLYAWAGQRSAALVQYRNCVRILDEELGVSPLPETTELYHAIQSDRVTKNDKVIRWQGDKVTGEESVTLSSGHQQTHTAVTVSSPLIGRANELDQMHQFYQQVSPNGRLLIIEGEPGIGKTRLAEALVQQQAAAPLLAARCYEGETNLAYAPLIQALHNGLNTAVATWAEPVPERHLAEAARLLPELAARRPLPPVADLDAPGAQVRFYEGIAQVLLALLAGSAPGILWLDDAQWLDTASQEFLRYLLHRLAQRPFLILLCWRQEEMAPTYPLLLSAASLQRTGQSLTISPQRFTLDEIYELLAASGLAFSAQLPQQLITETEGLPFFVVEYLKMVGETGELPAGTVPTAVPTSVRDLLHHRLLPVSETERQILQTAAAVGHGFGLKLVQVGSGRSADETVAALEQLVARGLLVENTARDQGAYDFSHDKLRTLVYEEMGLARRRLLHRRLAETLAQPPPRRTTADLAQIARHYQLAGQETEAATYFVQAGDQARTLFAHQDALAHYNAALALGADNAWRLHAACGELHTRLGTYPEALARYETAAALAPAAELGMVEHQLGQVYQRQGDWSLAAQSLAQAQRHLENGIAGPALTHVIIDRSLVAYRQKAFGEAQQLAEAARTVAQAAGDEAMLALAANILGMLARHSGELATAVSLLEQSCELAAANGRLDIEIAARNNLALTLGTNQQYAAAKSHLEMALALCQRYGDRHYEAALRSNLADVLHQTGDKTAAQDQIRQSAAIYAAIGQAHDSWQAQIWQLMEW